MDNLAKHLIDYGKLLLRSVTSGEITEEPRWVIPFMNLISQGYLGMQIDTSPLRAVTSLIEMDGKTGSPAFIAPVEIEIDVWPDTEKWLLFPHPEPDVQDLSRQTLWTKFVQAGGDTELDLDRFYGMMQVFASTLPNTYGEAGVSLFQQWKSVSALVFISKSIKDTPSKIGLVSGDIPGIQRTINLVTSKGAAKAMRGRSSFIQFLGDALVLRLLSELQLSQANVIYDAGGNFLLLTPWGQTIQESIRNVALDVNRILLKGIDMDSGRFDGFHGDLAVALAGIEIPLEALSSTSPSVQDATGQMTSLWQLYEKSIKDAVAELKFRPFGDLAIEDDDGWKMLFQQEASETDDFCAVCRRQRRSDETFDALDQDISEGISIRSNKICPECMGFNQLANALGHRGARLLLGKESPTEVSAWQRCLHAVSGGWWYCIGEAHERGEVTVSLDLGGFPQEGVDAQRLVAHTTPMDGRTIKPNDQLAAASEGGLKRLGVLRMDVDDLGLLLVKGLPKRTLAQTSEISQTVERFFAGWLPYVCGRLDKGEGWFYVLFAGGDDLFITGPWSAMTELARAIYDDFNDYTGMHPAIHLSAGIAVVGEKSPLHTAANEALEALEVAKHFEAQENVVTKDAITFLGASYRWHDFKEVEGFKDLLVSLVDERGKNLPKSVLTTLMAIARRYYKDHEVDNRTGRAIGADGIYEYSDGRKARLFYGPWMWKQAYSLFRIGKQRNASVEMAELERNLLSGRITDLGLAARWAQWLTRQER